MIQQFDELIAGKGFPWKLRDILPKVLVAGEPAGVLTAEGARRLDPSGNLRPGIPLCPPEGDAGTGMVATNSVARRTGNVSAGTSVFAMVVLERELSKVYREIDLVTTPAGDLVAMVHCNNCTSDLNAWVSLFREFSEAMGMETDTTKLFSVLYNKALEGDADCGGLLSYGYYSGEHITHFEEGRPLFARMPDARFNLANFMRVHLFTALGALKTGLDILFQEEQVKVDQILGHGGLFKTKGVGQRIMAAAMNTPVSVMETAGEGGAWGIALLADYMLRKEEGETLDHYLANRVFAGNAGTRMEPDEKDVKGFEQFMKRYREGLSIERAAVEVMR
jgi:sugar (pentulose or hexulose) kinase